MKVLLVSPQSTQTQGRGIKNGKARFSVPTLTLPYLAAITPSDIEVSIVDERTDCLTLQEEADLVGISVMTMTAPHAYEIADTFRRRGTAVVLGGLHPTLLPEEASQHADAIVLGEAEGVWQQLLMDFQRGELQKVYRRGEPCSLENLPHPRWDLLNRRAYFSTNVIQTTRGCPHGCSFCTITKFFGRKYRQRPVSDVIREVEASDGKFIGFADADTAANRLYAKELFEALIPHRKVWVTDAGIRIADDESLLRLAAKSGCKALYIGFESLSPQSLKEAGKSQNTGKSYAESIDRIHQAGIAVGGGFIFGFDSDTEDVFERTVEFAVESKIDYADFNVLCPYPGTKVYDQFRSEDRIIETDWSKYYGGCNVVYQPKQMSVEALHEGCLWVWREFLSTKSILKRFVSKPNLTSWINTIGFIGLNVGSKFTALKSNEVHGSTDEHRTEWVPEDTYEST